MVYTAVLETVAERIESSSLSWPTKQSAVWRNWIDALDFDSSGINRVGSSPTTVANFAKQ